MNGATRAPLPGGRWHFQHGPIDIVIAAEGDDDAVAQAHAQAWDRFQTVLTELVQALPVLRQPLGYGVPVPRGEVAQLMHAACVPLVDAAQGYLTPMAAVAGSVAQTLVAAYQRPGVQRAWLNNGGDIALHLAPGQSTRLGLYADLARFDAQQAASAMAGQLRTDLDFAVAHDDPVRGVATSGWRGRSHSRGVADAVTVLAATAAMADAAATVIANAVNVDDPLIERQPAQALRDDSDLGSLLVTTAVPPLAAHQVQLALQQGLACAQGLQQRGLVFSALLVCQGSLARLMPPEKLQCLPKLVQ